MKTKQLLPADTAAIWGAFLYEGLMMTEHTLGEEKTLMDFWKEGYLELVTEACQSLDLVWFQLKDRLKQIEEVPGVFEYAI
jgi:hypothetical protein